MEPKIQVSPYVPALPMDENALSERQRLQLEALRAIERIPKSMRSSEHLAKGGDFKPEALVQQARRTLEKVQVACEGVIPPGDDAMLDKMMPWASVFQPELALGMYLDPVRIRWLWYLRWAQAGFPRIVWESPRYPEMLMATSAHPETIGFVRPPWGAFLVDLPPDLLFMKTTDETGQRVPTKLVNMMVQYYSTPLGPRWMFMGQAERLDEPGMPGGELWRFGIKTEDLLQEGEADCSMLFGQTLTDSDSRLHLLLGRLVVGLCLTLSNPDNLSAAKNTKQKTERLRQARRGNVNHTVNYIVKGRPNVVVRETLQSYIQHGEREGASPNVRTLVRGHWKMQPYGVGRSRRKLIHIRPYWRGPDDGPVIIRETVVAVEPPSTPGQEVPNE